MTIQDDLWQDWFWQRLIDVLSRPNSTHHMSEVNLLLRKLKKYAFTQLKAALEGSELSETSWSEPSIFIKLDIQEPAISASLAEVERNAVRQAVTAESVILQILTAGAAMIEQGDSLQPLASLHLVPLLEKLTEKERINFFHRWTEPTSYGDEAASSGTIIARSDSKETFQAGLSFRIGPRIIDSEANTSYHVLEAGLLWEGNSHPETWSQAERDALWETIFHGLDALVENTESGRSLPSVISQRVPVQPPPRKSFRSFDFILNSGPEKGSYPGKVSARNLKETALGAIEDLEFVPPPATGPIMDISNGDGKLLPDAALRVLMLMSYPDNPQDQEEFLSATEDAALSAATKSIDVDEVLQKRPFLLKLSERAAKSGFGGAFAGDLLLFLLNTAEHKPNDTSVLKALHVIRSDYKDGKNHAGKPLSTSRSTLLQAWTRFKPVAHLWAALRLWQKDLKQSPIYALVTEGGGEESLINFLSIAEELRRRGEDFVVRSQKESILPPSETWRTPADLILKQVSIEIPDLTVWAKERLSEYRLKPGRS